jgi:hypothetical protein
MPRPNVGLCAHCGVNPKRVDQTYCSRACWSASRWVDRTCQQCDRVFAARRIYVDRGQMKYCSAECSQVASRRRDMQEFDGDRFYPDAQGHYQSRMTGRFIHRVIWESAHGPIPDGHVIHHIDHDKSNNVLENFMLMLHGEHAALHMFGALPLVAFMCRGCCAIVERRESDIRRGQDKFCSRACANIRRGRDQYGRYA